MNNKNKYILYVLLFNIISMSKQNIIESNFANSISSFPDDDELYLSNDDWDVEIGIASDDEASPKKKKGGKQKKDTQDDASKVILPPIEDEDLNISYSHDKYQLNDIVDEMKQPPIIVTNKSYTGIIDPIKYRIMQSRRDTDEYIVPSHKAKTSHILGKAEKALIIGNRAQHISMGAQPYVDVENEEDPIAIAEKELRERKMPLLLLRKLNDFTYEEKDPNEMTINWQD